MTKLPRKFSPAWIVALISLPIFIGALDLTVVSAVLPHVIYDLELPFQTGMDDASWMVSGYLLAYTIAMTFMGKLSDILGRRKAYLIALAVFALGSYLVAVAETWPTSLALRFYYQFFSGRPDASMITLYILIGGRMIQAFGGGAMVPVGMALVGDLYPPEKRARPLSIIAAFDTGGWVIGHLYGGIITRYFTWKLIFWLNIPFCIIAFILIAWALRGVISQSEKIRMDWLGTLLITLALSFLNIGLGSSEGSFTSTVATESSGLPPYAVPFLIISIIFLGLFIWRQAKARYPLIPLQLFKNQNFTAASLANFLIGVSLFIAIANVPLFINTVTANTIEEASWDSGWMLCALTIPMAFATIPGGWLTEKKGYRLPAILGVLVGVVGFAILTSWKADTPYGMMVPQLMLAGIGLGLTMAPITTAVVNAAPEEYRGISSALVIIFRLIGMTVGVSGMTTYGLHRAEYLSELWLQGSTDLQLIYEVAIRSAVQVISEIFLIAGIVCLLAVIPVLLIRNMDFSKKL
jgi:MFS family permease